MNYLNLTRDQAISLVGIETIEKLEKEIHKPECRFVSDVLVGYNEEEGITYSTFIIQYKVFIKSNDESAEIVAYYRVDDNVKDLNNFDWGEAHHYAIY